MFKNLNFIIFFPKQNIVLAITSPLTNICCFCTCDGFSTSLIKRKKKFLKMERKISGKLPLTNRIPSHEIEYPVEKPTSNQQLGQSAFVVLCCFFPKDDHRGPPRSVLAHVSSESCLSKPSKSIFTPLHTHPPLTHLCVCVCFPA